MLRWICALASKNDLVCVGLNNTVSIFTPKAPNSEITVFIPLMQGSQYTSFLGSGSKTQMRYTLLFLRFLAIRLGLKSILSSISFTFFRAVSDTFPLWCSTLSTVPLDTPAKLAISRMVYFFNILQMYESFVNIL